MPILHLHQRHRSGTNTKPAGRRHFRFFSSARPAEPTAPAPSSSTEEARRGRDSARDLMIEEYLAYPQDARVEDVLDDLRDKAEQYAHYDVQYAYVLSEERLVGVLRLRDLLLSPRSMPIALIMIAEPIHVHGDARLEELKRVFDRHPLFGIPAVDEQHRMIGVVRRAAVEKAFQEGSNRAFLKFMGIVGGEELRSMPFRQRSLSRLSWLGMNVFLNVIAASIIAYHQDTLSAVISLAVFLPIISDMSGCSGNQAVAVTMRELMLGLAKPAHVFRVLSKEATVGVFNGIVLGLMLGAGLALERESRVGARRRGGVGLEHDCRGLFGRRDSAAVAETQSGPRVGLRPDPDHDDRHVRVLLGALLCPAGVALVDGLLSSPACVLCARNPGLRSCRTRVGAYRGHR